MGNQPDQLQPHALCTLLDVCKRVPGYEVGDDGEIDEILNDLIVQESRDFTETTHREVVAKNAETIRTFDVDWIVYEDRELFIGDAATITGVVLKLQDGTVTQTLTSAAWIENPRVGEREDWEPINSLIFPRLVLNAALIAETMLIDVEAAWGFPVIPDTIRRAVATLVVMRYLNDVAAAGTAFAELANQGDLNMDGALRAALNARDRFTIPLTG